MINREWLGTVMAAVVEHRQNGGYPWVDPEAIAARCWPEVEKNQANLHTIADIIEQHVSDSEIGPRSYGLASRPPIIAERREGASATTGEDKCTTSARARSPHERAAFSANPISARAAPLATGTCSTGTAVEAKARGTNSAASCQIRGN